MSYNGETILNCESGNPCLGLHENSRAYASYVRRWIWLTAVFKDDNNSVAINLGYTHDDTNSTFDWLFINENVQAGHLCDERSQQRPVCLGQTSVSQRAFRSNSSAWISDRSDNRLGDNLVLLKMRLLSSYGKFSGRIVAKDGNDIRFTNKFGFFEDIHLLR